MHLYVVPLSEYEENVDEWLLIKHGAVVNYLALIADAIASRRKTTTFTDAYPNYGRMSGTYPDYVENCVNILKSIP